MTIARFVKANGSRLRFTHLGQRLIVYISQFDECETGAPGYRVLNGACNEYDQPGEMPKNTHPMPGCLGARRPWYPGDMNITSLIDDPESWGRKAPGNERNDDGRPNT
ncbi:MAG: hypothetical protein M3N13_06830 [Candidatus Eremiobacteraeota bacterium]|nr:hypothetical protein [Candidatus Eremiobacteraeota bacterium]